MIKVDYTSLSMFNQCPKKYYWRMVRGLVLADTGAMFQLEFGRCIHAALDVWYAEKDAGKAVEKFASEWTCEGQDPQGKRTLRVGSDLLKAYHERYKHAPVELLETEAFFELPLGEGVGYFGHVDKVLLWAGTLAVMDHKTTYSLAPLFFAKIWPSMQFGGYVLGMRQKYPGLDMIVLDGLLVSKTLKTLSKAADENFGREIKQLTEEEGTEVLRVIKDVAGEIVGKGGEEACWRCNYDSCIAFESYCPYRRLCTALDAREREFLLRSEYKVEPWEARKREGEGK